ncbi:MAG: sigma-54-dependent Fis family transcriptional regulator [Methylotenera sp.]|nr:sigma-54-dependent Fis family transcriptional regulator [Oligoflexia bacterium]
MSVHHLFKKSILVIDDDEQITDILTLVLENEGWSTQVAHSDEQALALARAGRFHLMLLDLRLGEVSGLDVLPQLRELAPEVPIFMITAHGDVDSAVNAFNLGANGYIKKPFVEGALVAQIAQAMESYCLKLEVNSGVPIAQVDDVRSLVRSRDPVMDPLLKRIATAAQINSNVVISGESGTGKELVAKALHQFGMRRQGPFIAINCAALPESLLESELFGHVRGAFTDARENKPGLFARAEGGTLFLDEIGDAPPSIQAKLLRVLQEREVVPVGGSTPIKVDVRIIAASHKSLQTEVARGAFRQDLFYRLHVIPLYLPALRERKKDILLLASLFATRIAGTLGSSFDGFTSGAEQALESHDWPGNVRELQNRIEQAIALGESSRISSHQLFPELMMPSDSSGANPSETVKGGTQPQGSVPSFFEAKNFFEKSYLEKVLLVARGNISRAAKLASKSRTEVYGLMKKHGIHPQGFK